MCLNTAVTLLTRFTFTSNTQWLVVMEHFGCEKNFLEITRNYWKLLEITTDYWKLLVLFRITTTTFAMRHTLMVGKKIVTHNMYETHNT